MYYDGSKQNNNYTAILSGIDAVCNPLNPKKIKKPVDGCDPKAGQHVNGCYGQSVSALLAVCFWSGKPACCPVSFMMPLCKDWNVAG